MDRVEQWFPFQLKSDQLGQIDVRLQAALARLPQRVEGPFEQWLRDTELIGKLNEIDHFMRQPQSTSVVDLKSASPHERVERACQSVAQQEVEIMLQEAMALEQSNRERELQFEGRRQAIRERVGRVEAMQGLFDAGLETLGKAGMEGKVEMLIDKLQNY